MTSEIEPRPNDVSGLCQIEQQGRCPDFLFFWSHQPRRDDGVGPGCLSQWWPASFTVNETTYPSAEHFMMAGKARLFGDEVMVSRILDAPSPGIAKALGRAISRYDEERWAAHRYGIVLEGNIAKFGQTRIC